MAQITKVKFLGYLPPKNLTQIWVTYMQAYYNPPLTPSTRIRFENIQFDELEKMKSKAMSSRIHTVAVIGAGVSGVSSALHLGAAGLEVTVYEQSSSPGGVWYVGPKTLRLF